MNDSERVGGAERVGGLRHDAAGFFDRELAPPPDPSGDRFAVDIAHDEVDQAFALADCMDGNDVRMRQPRGGLSFAGEPGPDVALESELGRQHLDGDSALESLVARAIDDAHAAPTDLAFERVHAAQRLGESGW